MGVNRGSETISKTIPNRDNSSKETASKQSTHITAINHSCDVVIQVNRKTTRLSVRTTSELGLFVDQPWDDQLATKI